MATYNGQEFVREQIGSIISEMGADDELILVDDCSSDATVSILASIVDSRIRIFINETNKGHVFSFGRAISLARNEVVFLSDQDDIWVAGRKNLLVKKLVDSGKYLASSNFSLMDAAGGDLLRQRGWLCERDSCKALGNILGIFLGSRQYFGCAMAFRRELACWIVPIPAFVESHDLWIALAANIMQTNVHVEAVTLRRRIHEDNASSRERRALPLVLKSRIILGMSILVLIFRIVKRRSGWRE